MMNNSADRLSYLHPAEQEYTTNDYTVNPVKNLNDLFAEAEAPESEHLKVYLRIRPSLPEENVERKDFQVDLPNDRSIILTAPAASNTFKNSNHGVASLTQKFSFTHIYGPSTTQKELFEESTQGLVLDYFKGQSVLLFSYGATNSGKTFTVQGKPTDPGILPRTLDLVFKSIGERHYPKSDLAPRYFCDIRRMEEKDIRREEEKKQNIFKTSPENMSRFSLSVSNLSKLSSDLSLNETQPSTTDTSAVSSVIEISNQEDLNEEMAISDSTVYAVFVSFAEIYNEYIYDLLEPMSLCKKNKRNPLMLGEDRNGSIYIKGIHEVRVNTAEEAWQLLEIGRQNLHFAATRLNHNSSRSHCIFTIKTVCLADANNPHVARVSMMSICDLAGAERAGKTKSNQDRLKEAGNINTSLLVLSRCLDALRQNQSQKGVKRKEIPVPYRDSKLTRIFQSFFLGRGKAAMIVNISKSPLMFDETLQVLKFSAIAKQVAISHSKEPECEVEAPKRASKSSQFSKFVRQSLNTSGRLSVPWMKDVSNISFGANEKHRNSSVILEEPIIEEEEDDEDQDERYEALLKLISQLRDKLFQEHKEKVEMEDRLRAELCNEFSQQIVEIENSWNQRLKEQQSRMNEFNEYRIGALMKSVKKTSGHKRLRSDLDPDEEYVSSICLFQEQQKVKEQQSKIEELEMQNSHLKEDFEAMKLSQKKTIEKANRSQEENSKLTFQLAQLTRFLEKTEEELEDARKTVTAKSGNGSENQEILDLQRRLEENKSLLSSKDGEIKELKEMLLEAAEEFIKKEEEIQNYTKSLEGVQKINTKQLMSINELESQLLETREISSQHALQLEERDQHISELQELLSVVQNVEDMVSEIKKLRNISESYQTQVLILEQNLTATEKERNIAEKELEEIRLKKRQIEEDYLRDKSKLLLEIASLKKNGISLVDSDCKESLELQEALMKITQLEKEADKLSEEKGHLKNQVTETKDLLDHLRNANTQLESHQKTLLREKEALAKDLEELSQKLMAVQNDRAVEQLDSSVLKTSNVSITNQVNTLKNTVQDKEELIHSLTDQLNVQGTALEEAKLEKGEVERVSGELMEKILSLEEELLKVKVNLEKKEEVNCILKQKEELLHQIEKERELALQDLTQERKSSAEAIEALKSEMNSLSDSLRAAQQSLKDKSELEEQHLKSLHEKESVIEENACVLNNHEVLEEEVKSLKQQLKETTKESERVLEKLTSDLESQKELNEQLRQDLDKMSSSKKAESEKFDHEKESLSMKLDSYQESLTKCQRESEDHINKLTEEKESVEDKFKQLEMKMSVSEEENGKLKAQLEESEEKIGTLKDAEVNLRAQILEVKESESITKEQKLSSQQDLLSCKEDLLSVRSSLAKLEEENASLKERLDSSSKLQNDLTTRVEEKEQVISSLSAKVESLDRKLQMADQDSEKKVSTLAEKLDLANRKCDVLEKEARAVREARQEEISQRSSDVEEREEQLRQRDLEVSSLQQELKKLLQMSMTSSLCNESQNSSDILSIKKENEEQNKFLEALKEEIRQKDDENKTLGNQVMDLRNQLENLSLSSGPTAAKSSHKRTDLSDLGNTDMAPPSPTPRRQGSARKTKTVSSCSTSDVEITSVSVPKCTPKSRSTRKANTPVMTPVEVDSMDDFLDCGSLSTDLSRKSRSSRPQRASRRVLKIVQDNSLEYSDCDSHQSDEAQWKPPEKKSTKGSRKTRGRKTKTSEVFNPHLCNQENKSIIANQSQENIEQERVKSPSQRRKRHLLKSVETDMYMGSPNLAEVPRVDDSPHSVVRRQLRSKRK